MQQQRKHVAATLKASHAKPKPLHHALSAVQWEGRNIMPKAARYRWADNENDKPFRR